jgi:hypothetical protein
VLVCLADVNATKHTNANDVELETTLKQFALDLRSNGIKADMTLGLNDVGHVGASRWTVHLRSVCLRPVHVRRSIHMGRSIHLRPIAHHLGRSLLIAIGVLR